MYKHILIPTDGSKLSNQAVTTGLKFAKSVNAKVTCLFVLPHFRTLQEGDEGSRAKINKLTESLHKEEDEAIARKVLAPVEKLANDQGIPCTAVHVSSNLPYQAIIDTAKKNRCDLILMASHGRSGVQAVLLGSETTKVLTHAKIPVLVVR